MSTKSKFTVSSPRNMFWYMLCGAAIGIFLPIPFTVFQGPQNIALYILCAIIAIPFLIMMLKTKMFRIRVSAHKITVRKITTRQYSFDVSEILRVVWRINQTRMGQLEKITVWTDSKHFSVETLMTGFEHMSAYLSANVDSTKINIIEKIFDFD